MRKLFVNAIVLGQTLTCASAGLALEKVATRMTEHTRADVWNAGTSCSIAYYNTCTGWVWVWSGWGPGDKVGVAFESCCTSGTLATNHLFAWSGAPNGYGFTGTIGVYNADANRCPTGSPIAEQVYLPISGWNQFVWNVGVGSSFVIQTTHGITTFANPSSYATDHPAAGPTGPAACGTCFPLTRVNHSFYYGTAASPLCPGSVLNDGVCNSQLLWDAQIINCPVSVDESSWGAIKSLYR
jgi:hypothetical protein